MSSESKSPANIAKKSFYHNYTPATKFMSFVIYSLYLFGAPNIIEYVWENISIENEGKFYFFIGIVWHEIVWLIPNTFFIILYKFDFEIVKKYKVNNVDWPWKGKKKDSWTDLLKSTAKVILLNHFLLIPLLLLPNLLLNKCPYRIDKSAPSYLEFFLQYIFFAFMDDLTFYWSHRLLHTDWLYEKIHKVHHRYQNTISFAAEYAHPIEFLLGNVVPANIGAFILRKRVHLGTQLSYLALKLYRTTEAHSGYEFPWFTPWFLPYYGTSSFHNYHHLYFKGNYSGFFCYWDYFLGTVNKRYLEILETLPSDPYEKKKISE